MAQLPENELLDGLATQQLRRLETLAKEVWFTARKIIFREREQAEHIYLLTSGSVGLILERVDSGATPEPQARVLRINEGQVFGWSGMVSPFLYTLSARAETDVRAVEFESKAFCQLLTKNPGMGFVVMTNLSQVIARRLKATQEVLVGIR